MSAQRFVYLPVALHPGVRSALLISYGVGGTAKALTETPGANTRPPGRVATPKK